MSDINANNVKVERARILLKDWKDKQGHDQCWYYSEIFHSLCELFEVDSSDVNLPSREDFEEGCRRYQDELYGEQKREQTTISPDIVEKLQAVIDLLERATSGNVAHAKANALVVLGSLTNKLKRYSGDDLQRVLKEAMTLLGRYREYLKQTGSYEIEKQIDCLCFKMKSYVR